MSAASCRIDFRRGTKAVRTAPATTRPAAPLDDLQVGDAGGVVLPPAPDRERRVAVELEAERALGEDAGRVQRVRLEQEDEEGCERGAGEAEREAAHRGPQPVRIGEPERRQQERSELRPARERDAAPRAQAEEASQNPRSGAPA